MLEGKAQFATFAQVVSGTPRERLSSAASPGVLQDVGGVQVAPGGRVSDGSAC